MFQTFQLIGLSVLFILFGLPVFLAAVIGVARPKGIFSPIQDQNGNIDPIKVVDHILQATDWVALLEGGFKDPDNPELPLRLLPWQKDAIRKIQYDKGGLIVLAQRGYAKTTTFMLAMAAACIAPPYPYFRLDVAYVSIGLEEALRAIEVLKRIISYSKYSHLIRPKESKRQITFLHNSSKFKVYPQTEGIRGLRAHYVIYDEWSRIREDLIGAIRPTLRKIGIKEIGGSTPAGMGGDFFSVWMGENYPEGEDPWQRIQIQDIVEFNDKGELIKFESQVPWMTKELFLDDIRRLGGFDSPMAQQELMAAFIGGGNRIIQPAWVQRAYDLAGHLPWVDHDFEELRGIPLCGPTCERYKAKRHHSIHLNYAAIPKVLAGDFGRHKDFAVFIIGGLIIGPIYTRAAIFWIDRFRRSGDYVWIGDRAINLMKRFNVRRAIFDGVGVGEGALDIIYRKTIREKLPVSFWKTQTSDIDQPGKKTKKLRLGFIPTSTSFTKQDIVQLLSNAYNINPPEIIVPFHQNQRIDKEPRYPIWEYEKELVNFEFDVTESPKTRKKRIVYGVQHGHDDIFMTAAMMMLCLKFPYRGHLESSGDVYSVKKRLSKMTSSERMKETGSYSVARRGSFDDDGF